MRLGPFAIPNLPVRHDCERKTLIRVTNQIFLEVESCYRGARLSALFTCFSSTQNNMNPPRRINKNREANPQRCDPDH